MKKQQHYFYHPFVNSSFGILMFDNDSNIPKNEESGFIVYDVNLYYQPLEHPLIAVSFFAIKLLFIIIGVMLCTKILRVVKREPSIDTHIMKIFCWTQITLHPILIFFDLTINLIHPINAVIGDWYCSFGWLLYSFSTKFVLNYSFFAALMRYFFVIHNDAVNTYGKEKFKRHFLHFSLIACVFGVIVEGIDNRELSRLSFINKCYGKDHKVFLIESSTLHVLQRKFWEIESDAFVKYGEILDHLISTVLRVIRMVKNSIFLLTGFNVMEGILYFKVFLHMQR